MNILMIHNEYQHKGGEDTVVSSEIELLQCYGHQVRLFSKKNSSIADMSKWSLVKQTIWSKSVLKELKAILLEFDADIIHVHNTFPLISPSIYWLANELNIPIIQTLHNFRLLCPQAIFLRNDKVCEECLGKVPWRGVLHGCYRDSVVQTGVLASMLVVHRVIGTWVNKVDRYIALNQFCKNKFIEGGLPANKIVVKPNFANSPNVLHNQLRKDFLFVGRLSQEKGVNVLGAAAKLTENTQFYVAGAGPEEDSVANIENITLLGSITKKTVLKKMNQVKALIVPSLCYESFPMTIVEAYSTGLPVIASKLGPLKGIVEDGKTGLLFEAGNENDLAKKIKWAENNPEKMKKMGENARFFYEENLSADKNYQTLISIYNEVIQEKGSV